MTNHHTGLSEKEAAKRLAEYGENQLSGKKKTNPAALFFSQFKDLMILILAVATVISVLMGEGTEAITIIVIVLLNAVMGFIQEYRTEKTMEALKEMSAPTAHVLRNGEARRIPAKEVVPGDVVELSSGDRVPADGQVLECTAFSTDEALLTGESLPVSKQMGDRVLMGSTVSSGHCVAAVNGTGMNTEMGKIAGMLDDAEEERTPLQQRLAQLGKFVAAACVIICLSVGFIGFLQGEDFLNMLLTGVSLAVAAIPEGMPAIVTIVLALSVGRILKKGAIIRKLHAVETLGCAGVICTDKTGTVTENRMTVKRLYCGGKTYEVTGDGYRRQGSFYLDGKPVHPAAGDEAGRLLRCAVLCSTAEIKPAGETSYEASGNPTETALLVAAAKGGFLREALSKAYIKTDETPFDSRRKLMDVTVRGPGGRLFLVKGAPDILLQHCTSMSVGMGQRPLTARDREEILLSLRDMGKNALRVIALAESSTPEKGLAGLTFLGLAGMIDPPRAEVEPAVRLCRKAGIKPVMITGDYSDTAAAIARQVGICRRGDGVLTGKEIDAMSDGQLTAACMKTAVYARVTPAHKLRIVKAYKAAGQIVAMTGDGANDAPAVKEADIGVAMNSGTDVTKEASSVVILDDNFATIVSAVEEGRIIYQNIRRFIRYLLTGNLGEVLSMLTSMLLGLPVALAPIQILMMNLLTDGLPAIALGMEPPAGDMMSHKPRPKNEGLFAGGLMKNILFRGLFLGLATSGAYYAVWQMSGDLILSRSAGFLTLVLSQMVYIFECRGQGLHFKGNPYLLAATGASVFLALASVYVPLLQPIFQTTAVTGPYLIPVCIGIFIGPLLAAVARRLLRLLRG